MIRITDLLQSEVLVREDAITVILIPSALLGGDVKATIFVGPVGIQVSGTEARRVRDLLTPVSLVG